ncbi:hypothetical protein DEO48_25335 [Enterobacter sp. CGMCC 5087]|uniref:phage baseplate plug family protein n=1 Tax=Enterobacter sp. CGMCC 5087 TaxID=2183878 RepID=UPI000D6772E8|nr:hypothetical protein [Enterobacter sp. CGMCC 5087]PWI77287.1 hypothetical protein DEO48_25335 [Enterobacter sp. CGMCC 5087]
MKVQEIPLSADNQQFAVSIDGVSYNMRILWRGTVWVLDLHDSGGNPLILGIPLITGTNLLEQCRHLQLDFALVVECDNPQQEYPTQYDLGTSSHLYLITEI